MAVYKARKEASEIHPDDTLTLDFRLPELWENTFPRSTPPSPWHFVRQPQQSDTGAHAAARVEGMQRGEVPEGCRKAGAAYGGP